MKLTRTSLVLLIVAPGILSLNAQTQQPSTAQIIAPGSQTPTFTTASEEVVLDVIVRDKKGKPIKDLKSSEIKVTDDGVERKVTGFRLVEGREAIENGARVPLDAQRQIRLVTLVFERLGTSGRRIARDAAENLVKEEQAQNVFFAVVAIDTQMFVLQEFTADKAALKKAIEKATSGQYSTFAAESDRIKTSLKETVGKAGSPSGPAAPATSPEAAGAAAGAAAIEKRTAEIMLEMLQFDSSFGAEEGTRMSIFSLLSLVRGQYSLPGRKSILYFSEGMYIPTHLDEPFRNISSTANRGNVTIYAVDARGVMTSSQNSSAASDLADAAKQTASDTTSEDGRVSKAQIMASDRAESSMRTNVQLPLRTLAESTGGFLIGDSNDLTKPLRQVSEEVSSYYEVTYNPAIENYDGKFRRTQVQIARKDTVVHARNGYFALPVNVRGTAIMPFELALMKALDSNPMPKDVEFRSAAMVVRPGPTEAKGLVVVEVPMSGIKFTEHVDTKTFSSRVSLLALVKNAKGEVVAKVSSDLPRSGPLALLPQARAGNYIYKEPLNLPPGRYTLETAVMDHEAGTVGTRKSSYVVTPKAQGVAMSSLYLVRNFQANAKDLDPNEPLQYQGGRITATLGGQVFAVKGAQMSTFFIVYPDPAIAEKPAAEVEFSVDGKVIAKSALPLPAADAQGRIAYVLSSPAESMPPATYLIHVIVKQGNSTADGMTQVQIAAR